MVTLLVGSGQTYTTFEGALAAIPETFVDDYLILFKDIAEYVYTSYTTYAISTGTHTVGSFRLTISADDGKAFKDNINPGVDALKYDTSKGVCFRNTAEFNVLLRVNCSNVTISDLMLKTDSVNGTVLQVSETSNSCIIRRIILDSNNTSNSSSEYTAKIYGADNIFENILVYQRNVGGTGVLFGGGSTVPKCRFVTCVRATSLPANRIGFDFAYNGSLNNCISYNFTTPATTGWTGVNGNNATDVSASGLPGSGNIYSLPNPFTSTSSASPNFNIISSSSIIGSGIYIADCPYDILGRTRANPPTIGCYEYIPAVTTISASPLTAEYSLQSVYINAIIYGLQSYVTIRL